MGWQAQFKLWLPILFLAGLVVFPLGFLTWLVFFTPTFLVQNITVVDGREHTARGIQETLEPVKTKNIFFVLAESWEKKLIDTIPQIRTVHVVRSLPGTLKVIVQEKQPHLLLLSQKQYYFLDEGGVAYEEARLDTLPGIILPTVKNDDAEGEVRLGTTVVTPAFVQLVSLIQGRLPGITHGTVAEVRIPSLAAREVHFSLDTNWQIRFDATRSAEAQLTVLNTLLEKTIPPEQQAQIEYIDLRIPNRVYYKLRSSGPVPPTPAPPPA